MGQLVKWLSIIFIISIGSYYGYLYLLSSKCDSFCKEGEVFMMEEMGNSFQEGALKKCKDKCESQGIIMAYFMDIFRSIFFGDAETREGDTNKKMYELLKELQP